MESLRTLARRVRNLFRGRAVDAELDAELASHLEMAAEEHMANGLSASEARRRARVELGGLESAKELHREARGIPWLEAVGQDLRYAARTLRRETGFAVFAVLILGLGIGASSTVFSVVHTLLVRPLPFADDERLVWIANSGREGLSAQTVQVGHLLEMRGSAQSYRDLAGYMAFYGVGDRRMTGTGEPERLTQLQVSQNFFPTLGVGPMLGRLFSDEECRWNGPQVVLLSHGFWTRRFASDPAIVGRKLTMDETPVTVVGVLPESFDFGPVFAPGTHFDVYAPFPLTPETNRWGNTMSLVGRLKPGVTVAAAQQEANLLGERMTKAHPEWNSARLQLTPLREHVSGRVKPALLVLSCAVGVVMLIVCANLSNLLLARMTGRQKEFAVRAALGAGRGRLVRQLLTESLLLAGAGAVVGLAIAYLGTAALARLEDMSVPLLSTVRLDWRVALFTVLGAVATGVLFGMAPAWQVGDALMESTRGASDSKKRSGLRNSLVVMEIAFACILMVGAGLLMRSFLALLNVNLGFDPFHTAAIRIDPAREYTSSQEKANGYFNEALRLARDIPGVEAAALTDTLPLGRNRTWGAGARGQTYTRGEYPTAFVRITSDGYFEAMRIPMRAGRDFTAQDTEKSDPVIIINESLAKRLWPGQDPLGQYMNVGPAGRRVVGVVGNVRHLALEKESGSEMYVPMRQTGDFPTVDLVLRTSLPPAQLTAAVRRALQPIDPNLASNAFRTVQGLVERSVSQRKFVVTMLGGFAVFAVVLASLGIYAVVMYSVTRRTHEIGIRMALGEPATSVQGRIVKETLTLAGVGMLLGSIGAWGLARGLSGLLYGVTADDPVSFLAMLVLIGAVALVAGYLPARRASRIDPMIALRTE
jgi:predicted permease